MNKIQSGAFGEVAEHQMTRLADGPGTSKHYFGLKLSSRASTTRLVCGYVPVTHPGCLVVRKFSRRGVTPRVCQQFLPRSASLLRQQRPRTRSFDAHCTVHAKHCDNIRSQLRPGCEIHTSRLGKYGVGHSSTLHFPQVFAGGTCSCRCPV